MEESIKRAEKLVHATNSALAQMKYNVMFNSKARKGVEKPIHSKKSLSFAAEMDEFEKEFRADATEILSKMDKILEPSQFVSSRLKSTQASKMREKMREINRILSSQRSDLPRGPETEESLQKFLSLVNEDEVPLEEKPPESGKSSARVKGLLPRADVHTRPLPISPVETGNNAEKLKGELKLKLLETEEVVDRGFQTVRHLSERVDHMAKTDKKLDKTFSSEKSDNASDVINLKSLRESRKIESKEILTRSPEKCYKCRKSKRTQNSKEGNVNGREKEIIETHPERDVEDRNILVNVKRCSRDPKTKRLPQLCFYRLPSIHIRGDLQVQMAHNLVIPGNPQQDSSPRANTLVKMLSHEDIEKEKTKNLVEKIQRENCFCLKNEENVSRIECYNCGKLNRIPQTPNDPREIDQLLFRCDFNVFDPRIDEFVEKCRGKVEMKKEKPKETLAGENKVEKKEGRSEGKEIECKISGRKVEKARKHLNIRELSQKLTRSYKDEINHLEKDHEELEKILKSLFKKIDESRKLFDLDNDLTSIPSQTAPEVQKQRQTLTITKPQVVCLGEKHVNEENETTYRKGKTTEPDNRLGERNFRTRERRKIMDKQDVKNKCKSRTLEYVRSVAKSKAKDQSFDVKDGHPSPVKVSPRLPVIGVQILNEIYHRKSISNDENQNSDNVDQECVVRPITNSYSRTNESPRETDAVEVEDSGKEIKTDNDYESDFEGESPVLDNNLPIEEMTNEEQNDFIPCVKKLSTITEVNSELEKKFSERSSSGSCNNSVKSGIEKECVANVETSEKKKFRHETDVFNKTFTKETFKRHPVVCEHERDCRLPSTPQSQAGIELQPGTGSVERTKSSKSKSDVSFSQNSSPTEVVASLKEVLFALKDQFARTQCLADKLTDNVKALDKENEYRKLDKPEIGPKCVIEPTSAISSRSAGDLNSQSSQKLQANVGNCDKSESRSSYKKSLFTLLEGLADAREISVCNKSMDINKFNFLETKNSRTNAKCGNEDEPSVGEIRGIDPRFVVDNLKHSKSSDPYRFENDPSNSDSKKLTSLRKNEPSKRSAFFPVASENGENSISEGEIVSNIVFEVEDSSMQSIGELISESISEMSMAN